MFHVLLTNRPKLKKLAEEKLYLVGGMSAVNKSADGGDSFSSKVINIVFIILLLDLLGFTLILPLLPSILDHYAQTEVSGCFVVVVRNKILWQRMTVPPIVFKKQLISSIWSISSLIRITRLNYSSGTSVYICQSVEKKWFWMGSTGETSCTLHCLC